MGHVALDGEAVKLAIVAVVLLLVLIAGGWEKVLATLALALLVLHEIGSESEALGE